MKVIVLGSGPAGLMAAQGVLDAHNHNAAGDLQMMILSRKVKSPLYGAQYLHQPIPGVTPDKWHTVLYSLRGDADSYRRKVYGQMWGGTVSAQELDKSHAAWDIRATYDRLWALWEYSINDMNIDPVALTNLNIHNEPDLIVNSIPRPALCHRGHAFGATEVWAAGDAPALGIRLPYHATPDTITCNGEDYPAWYRMSNVFGHTTVEWPGSLPKVPVSTASRVQKPTSHECDCWSELPLLHVGRYGEWTKGVLSHTAYFNAYKRVDEMIGASRGASA